MDETLRVTPEELRALGKRIEDISGNTRALYEHMKSTINAVTANDSWKSADSEALVQNFDKASQAFEMNLQRFEELGSLLSGTGDRYQTQEEENTAAMKEEAEWQN